MTSLQNKEMLTPEEGRLPTLPTGVPKRKGLRRVRTAAYAGAAGLLVLGTIAAYLTVPKGNEGDGPVDVLLVLGTPTELDGSVTLAQRWRVDEAVREWRDGRGSHLLFSGGPAANRFVESRTMAAYAERLGIPAEAVLEETTSRTTLENVRNSQRILDEHGWHRVEVISSPEHLPRAAVLLEQTHLLWRVHPAPTPGRSRIQSAGAYAEEAFGTAVIRVFGTRAEPVLHAIAVMQHGIGWGIRWVFYTLWRR